MLPVTCRRCRQPLATAGQRTHCTLRQPAAGGWSRKQQQKVGSNVANTRARLLGCDLICRPLHDQQQHDAQRVGQVACGGGSGMHVAHAWTSQHYRVTCKSTTNSYCFLLNSQTAQLSRSKQRLPLGSPAPRSPQPCWLKTTAALIHSTPPTSLTPALLAEHQHNRLAAPPPHRLAALGFLRR